MRTLTRSGDEAVIEGEGFLARCIQHEIDHLNGVLFIDHVKDGLFYNEATMKKANLLEVCKRSRGRFMRDNAPAASSYSAPGTEVPGIISCLVCRPSTLKHGSLNETVQNEMKHAFATCSIHD